MASSRADTARAAVDLTFEELYRGLRADVYRAALRQLGNAHDAEDVTQAAFADAYRAVLRGARPESPRAWLLAISENVRRRRFRTAQRRPREELVDDADFPLAAELPFEQSRELTDALATLPEEQGRVFVLREIVGLSYGEIAEELGSTVGSVQMLLFRARRSLRDALDPPTVAARRPLFLPPLPGWLVGLWSRAELATLTPRAAGALAGAVLTVGGASVAVPVSQADGLRPASAAAPSVAPAARPGGLGVVAKRAPRRSSTALDVSATSVRTTRSPRPAASGAGFGRLAAGGRPCRRSRGWGDSGCGCRTGADGLGARVARSRRDSRGGRCRATGRGPGAAGPCARAAARVAALATPDRGAGNAAHASRGRRDGDRRGGRRWGERAAGAGSPTASPRAAALALGRGPGARSSRERAHLRG